MEYVKLKIFKQRSRDWEVRICNFFMTCFQQVQKRMKSLLPKSYGISGCGLHKYLFRNRELNNKYDKSITFNMIDKLVSAYRQFHADFFVAVLRGTCINIFSLDQQALRLLIRNKQDEREIE